MENRTYPREWFGVNRWAKTPMVLQIQRETESCIFTGTRRILKITTGETWYPTREEAQTAIDARIAREQETARVKRIRDAAPELLEALEETWRVLRAAGLLNLTRGVQLGSTSWYVKACDAEQLSDAAIAKAKGHA